MKVKSISIQFPKSQFSDVQLDRLSGLGIVSFPEGSGSPIKYPKDTEMLAVDTDAFGGKAKARNRLLQLMDTLPNIKYLVLGSSDYSFLDLNYCRQRGIIVSPALSHDVVSKAEHIIALIMACSRRIIVNDRRTYRRKYQPEPGSEVRGKTLGVVGSGFAAKETILAARGLEMIVYSTERFDGAIRKPLDFLLSDSQLLTLHLPDSEQSKKFFDKEKIKKVKDGSIMVNLGNREWVEERAMSEALLTRKVDTYCFESESMGKSPLKGNEFALMFKPFSIYTKEARERNQEEMVQNIESIARGIPYSQLEL